MWRAYLINKKSHQGFYGARQVSVSSRSAWSLVYIVSSRPPKGSETLSKNKKERKEKREGGKECVPVSKTQKNFL